MGKWEYNVVPLGKWDNPEQAEKLGSLLTTQYGAYGWELVSLTIEGKWMVLFFKRPLSA